MSDDVFHASRSFAEIAAALEAMPEPRVIRTREAQRACHFRRAYPDLEVRIVVVADSQAEAEAAVPWLLAMPGDREVEGKVDLTAVRLPGGMREDGSDHPDLVMDLTANRGAQALTAAQRRALPDGVRAIETRAPRETGKEDHRP